MELLRGNAIVGQSGGPTAAINATLAGVIRGAMASEAIGTLYGMRNGIEGLQNERLLPLDPLFETEDARRLLEQTPAAALGSCRKKLPDVQSELPGDVAVYRAIFDVLRRYDIRYFFYIGGNDSMDTVAKMTAYAKKTGYDCRFVGVPKTIDNDLMHTDHTPGFGSAAKYIATSVSEILRDCAVYTTKAVTVVEIMGRDTGWLTAASALGRLSGGEAPDYVYLPEYPFCADRFFEDTATALQKHPNVVIAVSEGLRFADGRYVGEGTQNGVTDIFGHRYLAGTGKALEHMVKEKFGCKVRSVELNILQRCAGHLLSLTDIRESVEIGKAAVEAALAGVSGETMVYERFSTAPYSCRISHRNVSEIANRTRYVPDEFINDLRNNVTDECCKYLFPLIHGEYDVRFENGIPAHIIL